MNNILQADIFFFVTTLTVIVIAVLIVVAIFYVIAILRDIHKISKAVRTEGTKILHDVDSFRSYAKENKLWLRPILLFLIEIFKRKRK